MFSNRWDQISESTVVVIPIFNEAPILDSVLNSVRSVFPNVFCIDDGSRDGSAAVVQKNSIRIISHSLNIGQGGALQTAFSVLAMENRFKYLITFDADGQHDPLDAKRMLLKLVESDADVIFASRFLEGNVHNVPLIKRVMLRSVVKINRYLTDVDLTDTHNGLRAIKVSAAANLQLVHFGMAHATELVSKVLQSGLRYREISVDIAYTPYSKSKGQSVFNSVNILFDFLWR